MDVENGGRIELRLGKSGAHSAQYEAVLQTASQRWQANVMVGPKVEFGAWQTDAEDAPEPPSWLTEDARAALKAALRTSQSEGRWPRRITRWRPEPSR